jgi:hypothetical protein
MWTRVAIVTFAGLIALSVPATRAYAAEFPSYPDWSGLWRRLPDGGVPRYDPTKPLRKQEAPLTPDYQKIYESSLADQDAGGQGLDLVYRCFPQGMPRQMSGIFPFEIVIKEDVTYVLYELMNMQTRRIYTDGRDWPKDQEPLFTGYSIGKWLDTDGDGKLDTLEIETRNLRGPRTFDQAGLPMHSDNRTIIKERLYISKTRPEILHDEMTTVDTALTRPWTVLKSYRRGPDEEWSDNNCTEGNMHVTVGKSNYFLSGDGHLMPSKKDQPAPDLKYFK